MFAAYLGALFVDPTPSIRLQMPAAVIDQQKPAILVLVRLGAMVRYLPQQRVEILHRARRVDVLRKVGATGRICAEAALVFRRDFHLDGDGYCLVHGPLTHP